MSDPQPLVSVIIPVFNCRYISDALHSVMKQTYPFMEIIVVDDGSTDDTPEILARHEHIMRLRTENRGVAAARNQGLKACHGDLLSFLDADDLWSREKTANQVAFLAKHPDVDAVYGRFRNFFEEGADLPAWIDREKFLAPATGTLISPGTIMVRKRVLPMIGWFNETLKIGEDLDWFARFGNRRIRVFFDDHTVMRRRLHGGNISFSRDRGSRDLLKVFKAAIDRNKDQEPHETRP